MGGVSWVEITFRPLPIWPHENTYPRRYKPFSSGWETTMRDLRRELKHLDASQVILAARFREQDLRLDGLPKANAPQPPHPGIEISFDTPSHGRLVYASDACEHWQDNVRSIALGLEALRAVDRYGITRRGEQYAGWRQLGTGADGGPSIERGRALIREAGDWREAVKATHPDAGGDPIDFESVQLAREAGVA